MPNPKAAPKRRTLEDAEQTILGAGIHAATVELKHRASYRVRLLDGRRMRATIARGVSPTLLDECLRTRRVVMIADGESEPVILGALQTAPAPHVHEETGTFDLEAKHIRLRADATIALKVGSASLALDKSGVTRIEGQQMVIDVAALLRVLSARVELP
jgi:hypothetical protein